MDVAAPMQRRDGGADVENETGHGTIRRRQLERLQELHCEIGDPAVLPRAIESREPHAFRIGEQRDLAADSRTRRAQCFSVLLRRMPVR